MNGIHQSTSIFIFQNNEEVLM